MENWEETLIQFIRTLKELRLSAGLEAATKVGNRTIYRTDPSGVTANLVRIESLLKYITERYLDIEEEEIMTVTSVYSAEDMDEYYRSHGIEPKPSIEDEIKEIEADCVQIS